MTPKIIYYILCVLVYVYWGWKFFVITMRTDGKLFKPCRKLLYNRAIKTILKHTPALLSYPMMIELNLNKTAKEIFIQQGWKAFVDYCFAFMTERTKRIVDAMYANEKQFNVFAEVEDLDDDEIEFIEDFERKELEEKQKNLN